MPSKRPAAPKKTVATRATTTTAPKPARAKSTVKSTAKTAVNAKSANSSTAITHHDIAARAHDLYVQSGFQGHREVEFWLEAERQLKHGVKL
ncbi:MAG: DUF2934 domain-containing protein [Candidatus Eisenbacteria bacterium]